MRLRDVEESDAEAYVRMRCDPVMMAELGGPLPKERVVERLRNEVREAAEDRSWIRMIVVPDGAGPGEAVAGGIALWSHESHESRESRESRGSNEDGGAAISEIGWMVLPEYQGRGLAKAAVRQLLDQAARDGRWGSVHAFPAVTNGPSNGICRALGFRLLGEREVDFADRVLHCHHWVVEPGEHAGSGTDK
ncbi:GNAT family N-acetyltransferase [Streptomyces kaniharaensis]|uniref:GNAT family N-acetyltransferase n=1 Tax=Streptomyces kaniharaensis TaxID=212423 RepID=A0A6N7KPW3_9ACTN|nr:GNAT family N-acetyltransferase [Streptomyces kaniharaensis]MQS13471.1 GNAT family N-acetyltransferase [Streptomyces kaniharaensis]